MLKGQGLTMRSTREASHIISVERKALSQIFSKLYAWWIAGWWNYCLCGSRIRFIENLGLQRILVSNNHEATPITMTNDNNKLHTGCEIYISMVYAQPTTLITINPKRKNLSLLWDSNQALSLTKFYPCHPQLIYKQIKYLYSSCKHTHTAKLHFTTKTYIYIY